MCVAILAKTLKSVVPSAFHLRRGVRYLFTRMKFHSEEFVLSSKRRNSRVVISGDVFHTHGKQEHPQVSVQFDFVGQINAQFLCTSETSFKRV